MARKQKFGAGPTEINLELNETPGSANTPPLSAARARQILGTRSCKGVIATCQEYLTKEGTTPNGDALCADWNLFSRMYQEDPKQASSLLIGSLQHMMSSPRKLVEALSASGKLQEYTTKGDFPTEILDTIEVYHTNIRDIDNGWREIFDVKDFTGTKKNGFKIRDVQSGLTYRRVPTGDKVEVYGMEGTEVEVPFDRYGGALGWDRTWFEDEEFWQASDTAIEFRNKYFNDMARVHYALIEAIANTINLAWQAPSPAGLAATDPQYELSRDINTINVASVNIILNLENQGMDVSPTTSFILLAPLNLRARMNRALQATYGQASLRTPTQVEHAITPLYTTRLTNTDQYYLCVPKRKAKSGIRKNLEVFSDFDILSYSDVTAAWGRYGGAIAEIEQFQRCAIA